MERPFICGSSKYTISATNTIGLPVVLEDLPGEIVINGNKLLLKSSFHVSLVCINEILKKYEVKTPNFKDSVVKDFCEFIRDHDIDIIKYENKFNYAEKGELKTVVVFCGVSNIDKFFQFLNKKYNLNLEYPPTHVTLYAHDGKQGIFLVDSGDLNKLSKPIPNPIGRIL